MHNHFNASYEDYFISLIRSPLTVEDLADLAQSEYLCVNTTNLKIKLKDFALDNLSEQEFYDVVKIVLSIDDIYRFRTLLWRE